MASNGYTLSYSKSDCGVERWCLDSNAMDQAKALCCSIACYCSAGGAGVVPGKGRTLSGSTERS